MMIIHNYIIVAWRNIYNHKLFSAINILGLAIGLAACMLIALFVRDELSYDKFWTNADNIYRMHQTFLPTDRAPMVFTMAAGPIIHALKKDIPQVEEAARISNKRVTIIKDDQFFEEEISLVDPAFVKIFDFKPVSGDLEKTLNDNSSIVLNRTLANKFFPDGDAMGRTLTINADVYEREFQVSAIIEDMPKNSQVKVGAMVSIVEEEWKEQDWMFDQWFSVNSHLYFTLGTGTDINIINDQLPSFIDRHFPKSGGEEAVSSYVILNSQNIQDLHLHATGAGEYRDRGNINTVYTFSAVAVLILIIASINFMNLSTARASQRAREVSLRKVMGASRKALISQFIGESVIITFISLLISLVIIEMALPLYNQVINKELYIDYASADIILIIALTMFVGIMGGIYPALILSGFRPAEILKANRSSETGSSVKLRAALVIFQFAVSITLFVSTAVVYGQMLYAKNIELGFDKDNLLVINNLYRDAAAQKLPLLVNEYKRLPNVTDVTWSNESPGIQTENNATLRTPEMPVNDNLLLGVRWVGYDYFETYNIKLLAGRSYDINKNDRRAEASEIRAGRGHTSSLIINETATRTFGFASPEDALGKIIYRGVGGDDNLEREYQIIGVAPDLYLESLKKEIRPEIFELSPENAVYISIRFEGSPTSIVDATRTIWEREIPSIPFRYNHAVDSLEEQYQSERGEMTMFAAFSSLAIIIACLGLYGLASFTAEKRTKEIGVRKVMGASVFDIVKLLLWQFSKPVVIANLIAWPVSFYAMSVWLQSFAYRIENIIILGFCAFAGITALLVAWATVASNSMRVAKANPINALRYE